MNDKITVKYKRDTDTYVNKYLGVEIERYNSPIETALEMASNSIDKNEGVILGMDAMCCPWNKSFNKIHFPHYIMVDKIDYEKKK